MFFIHRRICNAPFVVVGRRWLSSGPYTSLAMGAVMSGTVKFYLREKGYGFIVADGRPDTDLFVHRSAIQCSPQLPLSVLNATQRYPYLKQNERVRFAIQNENGTVKAVNVTWLNGDPIPPERKNYLGGVYERGHRLLGEAVYAVMSKKDDIRSPLTEAECDTIRSSYLESKRIVAHAEQIIQELGMDLSFFPTIKSNVANARGRYLFAEELEKMKQNATHTAATAANVPPSNEGDPSTPQGIFDMPPPDIDEEVIGEGSPYLK